MLRSTGPRRFRVAGAVTVAFAIAATTLGTIGTSSAATTARYESENLAVISSSGDVNERLTECSGAVCSLFNGNAVGDFVNYRVDLREAGAYYVDLSVKRFHSRGRYQLAIKGAPTAIYDGSWVNHGGVQDFYSATPTMQTVRVARVDFGAAGAKEFRFTAVGKNAAADGYTLGMDAITLVPVAAPAPAPTPTTAPPSSDSTAPATTINGGPAQGTVSTNRSPSFSFSSNEAGTFECRIDGAAWAPCANPKTYSNLSFAVHNFEVRAKDRAGNIDASPEKRTFTVVGKPGEVKPNASNTGVPAGTPPLKRHDGDIVITVNGTHLDAMDIHGRVIVKAANAKITRSIIRGTSTPVNSGLVVVTHANATNFLIEDSELAAKVASPGWDGMNGWNYTARRIDSRGTVDNLKVHGNNVVIESSWLHDTTFYAVDPNRSSGPTHNDNIQILGGNNIQVVGNTIERSYSAGIQVTQDVSAVTNTFIHHNWIDGGGCAVNLATKPIPTLKISVTDNKFGRNMRHPNCAIVVNTGVTVTTGGNVWEDNGQPVSTTRGA